MPSVHIYINFSKIGRGHKVGQSVTRPYQTLTHADKVRYNSLVVMFVVNDLLWGMAVESGGRVGSSVGDVAVSSSICRAEFFSTVTGVLLLTALRYRLPIALI